MMTTIQTLAQVEMVAGVVDKAASASDRWLFLAALAIIIVGGVSCIRWLVNSLERKDKAHAGAAAEIGVAHAAERTEWRTAHAESKAQFMESLRQQRVDFREELAVERTLCEKLVQIMQCASKPETR